MKSMPSQCHTNNVLQSREELAPKLRLKMRKTMVKSSRFHLVFQRRDVSNDFMSTMLAGRDLSHATVE